MVERYDGEQLPPVHPQGRPPIGDGDRVPSLPPPPAPTHRERALAAVLVLIVLVAIALRALR